MWNVFTFDPFQVFRIRIWNWNRWQARNFLLRCFWFSKTHFVVQFHWDSSASFVNVYANRIVAITKRNTKRTFRRVQCQLNDIKPIQSSFEWKLVWLYTNCLFVVDWPSFPFVIFGKSWNLWEKLYTKGRKRTKFADAGLYAYIDRGRGKKNYT